MAIFSAPAWMMKAGGGSSNTAGASSWSDDDPWDKRTKVNCSVSNFSFNRTSFIMKLTVDTTGFTKSQTAVNYAIEVNKDQDGNNIPWRYWNFSKTIDFTKVGQSQTIDLSKVIKGSANLYKTLTHKDSHGDYTLHDADIYFIFYTATEICRDQIHPTITS